MLSRRLNLLTASSLTFVVLALTASSSQAHFSWRQHEHAQSEQSEKKGKKKSSEKKETRKEKNNPQQKLTEAHAKQIADEPATQAESTTTSTQTSTQTSTPTSTQTSAPASTSTSKHAHAVAGDDAGAASSAPLVVPPSTLDITTARFGKLEIDLKDAAFLEARVARMHLVAERLDMAQGKLSSLGLRVEEGEFQNFTLDSLELSSQADLHFDINALLNNKTLKFVEPALAQTRVVISQKSLNRFLNSEAVLERLSGTAKKRVPILSTLARQDVHFGFTFTGGDVRIEPDDHVHLTMHSKLGIGHGGLPVVLRAETKLALENGWVNLADTKLLTGGQTVPRDMADKIVRRINDLSKWGTVSDDIQFQFTSLKVIPNDRLELEGTATIRSLHFERTDETPGTTSAESTNGVATPTPNSNAPGDDNRSVKTDTAQPGHHSLEANDNRKFPDNKAKQDLDADHSSPLQQTMPQSDAGANKP